MVKSARKLPSDADVADLLIKTRRRCCLCVYLDGSTDRRKVQIAHIDGDRSNSSTDNLVPLCLDHHDEYDSRTSQSKGINQHELRAYKERLILEIADGTLTFGAPEEPYRPVKSDTTSLAGSAAYRYGVLFAEVSRVILAHDPVDINFGGNPDEYDAEAHDIISRLQSGETDDVTQLCRDVFTRWFSQDTADAFDAYEEMGADILRAWHHFEVMSTTYGE